MCAVVNLFGDILCEAITAYNKVAKPEEDSQGKLKKGDWYAIVEQKYHGLLDPLPICPFRMAMYLLCKMDFILDLDFLRGQQRDYRYIQLFAAVRRQPTQVRRSDMIHLLTGQPKKCSYRLSSKPIMRLSAQYTEQRVNDSTLPMDYSRYAQADEDSDLDEETMGLSFEDMKLLAARRRAGMSPNLHKTSNRMLTPLPSDAEDSDEEQGVVTAVSAASRRRTKLPKPIREVQDPQTAERSRVNGWLVQKAIQKIRFHKVY